LGISILVAALLFSSPSWAAAKGPSGRNVASEVNGPHCGYVLNLETIDATQGIADFILADANAKESMIFHVGTLGASLVQTAYQSGGVLCVCGPMKDLDNGKSYDANSPLRLAKTIDEARAFKKAAACGVK
jgi:hypothetical protein